MRRDLCGWDEFRLLLQVCFRAAPGLAPGCVLLRLALAAGEGDRSTPPRGVLGDFADLGQRVEPVDE